MTELTYKEFPSHCWWCGTAFTEGNGAEYHHIYRGSNRATSPGKYICSKCHHEVTINRESDMKMREVFEAEQENPYPF